MILRTVVTAFESAWGMIALKATIAMIVAMLIIAVTRRASAALRHVVLVATLGTLLLLPLAARLVPPHVVTVPVPMPARMDSASPLVSGEGVADRQSRGGRIDYVSLVYRIYGAGAALLAASLLLSVWRVQRIHRRAEVSVAGTRLAGVEVAISDELAVPITFGAMHPVILLPGSTRDWNEEDLDRAIRHELEHIARGDWATHIIARLACALYWPHPFVWVLWRRLRLEAERACDDAVIRASGAAEPYAEQLVSLARRLRGRDVPALAMATRSNLGQRVEAILDTRLRRRPLTRLTSLTVAVIATATMFTVAPYKLIGAAIDLGDERAQSSDEAEPLDIALLMASERDDRSTMKRLMDRGARADAAIQGDGTPLIAAARKGHIEAMKMLIAAGADVNRGVSGDGNPITVAARGGYLDAVAFLLDRGARIDEGIPGDGNALIGAAGAGEIDVVRFLLNHGASIEKVVPGDENALIHASETGQAAVVRLLIDAGANVNARVWSHIEWRTALSMATRNQHDDVVRILRAAGAKE